MVNLLRLKRNTNIKDDTFDKEKITKTVKGFLPAYKIMFIYFGGSIAYDTFNPNISDIDINVFVDGFKGYIHTEMYGYDVFVFGKEEIVKRQHLDKDLPDYAKLFIDDYFSLDETLIYLDPLYRDEFNWLKNFKMSEVLKPFLKHTYEYYMYFYVDNEKPFKRFYHVIRIRGQLENYKKTGVFNHDMPLSYRQELLSFKNNYDNENGMQMYRTIIPKYLEEIKQFEEGFVCQDKKSL